MLRCYFYFLVFLLPAVLCAQDSRNLLLGGTISFSSGQTTVFSERTVTINDPNNPFGQTIFTETFEEKGTYTSFGFFPYVGKIISPQVSTGLGLNLSSSTQKAARATEASISDRLGGYLWLRYTLNPSNKLRVYAEPRITYDRFSGNRFFFTGGVPLFDGNTNEFGMRIPLGAVYAVNTRLLANVRVGSLEVVTGRWSENDGDNTASYTEIGFRLNPRTISIGVEFLL